MHIRVTDTRICMHALHKKYGAFVRFGPHHISVNDVRAVEPIYGHNANVQKTTWYHGFYSISIFNAIDKTVHAQKKRVMSQAFRTNHFGLQLSTFYPVTPECSQEITEIRTTFSVGDCFMIVKLGKDAKTQDAKTQDAKTQDAFYQQCKSCRRVNGGSNPNPPPSHNIEQRAPETTLEGGTKTWLAVLGSSIALFAAVGWANSIGVFQAEYEPKHLRDSTSSQVSWIISMERKLSDSYGPRLPIGIGSLIHVFGLMMASISANYYQFMLS
ncbi:hypothetical protein BBP40_007048 [Aspergillus hancockii]|nr:hypothetical protein BBP40_007048 [Aspergillus hancockii]